MKQSLKLFAAGIVFSGVFCFSQCRKDNPKPDNPYGLPNATQWGAGVFACLINGQKFVARRDAHISDGAVITGDTLYLVGDFSAAFQYTDIIISVEKFTYEKKVYTIDSVNVSAGFVTDSTCGGITDAITSDSKNGNIVVTKFDTIRRIVSGTFDGLTFAIPGCDTLHVTNGRFDYHYYYK